MKKPVFEKVTQVSIVVDDIYAYIKRFNDDYGIGPWVIMHFNKDNTRNMTIEGKPGEFEIKLALCDALNIQLELIQPMDDNETYAEFLKNHGPGIHHLCMQPAEGYKRIREILSERGYSETLIGGLDAGDMEFAYVDITEDLGFIVELMNPPDGFVPPPPEDIYPR
jgi:methylmalonyl-CoA/ethylmalonyl-CoA epimerase